MTREEAISLLSQVNHILVNSNSWLENTHEPLNIAFNMAIKALEQESTTKNDCTEQNGCITCSLDDGDDCCRKLYEESMQKPTTKNDLGVDCVSRQFMYDLGATCIATRNGNGKLIALGAIEELPSVTPQEQRWIPVSERLPEATINVLVTSVGGYVYISRLVHGEWEYGGEVVAWTPLPKPYKVESGDKK